jgi:glycosyltransferase involved in cell wall biosynthesis
MKKILNINNRKTVLLFYKEYEADKFFKYDRYLKRILRPLYNFTHRRQKKTGFAVSFDLLRRALINADYDVRVNDYATAAANPNYPVGLVGFPVLLENWSLPNPAILGPSLFDHPLLAPKLFDDHRFRKYVTLGAWTKDLYEPVYGTRCFSWFAGIDLEEWPDLSTNPKSIDFIVYDKVRWDHAEFQYSLIDPILGKLEQEGLSYKVMRYKMHDHQTFRETLAEAKGMVFLCEHETQGLAYQEALASNVPILAWDRGFWADPLWKRFSKAAPWASSVPFFSPDCGETFTDVASFDQALETFMKRREQYEPRLYVKKSLSFEESAKIYADQYFSI